MADTAIEWAEKFWNPLVGCTYASPGCTNCYAVDQAWIRSHNPAPAIRAKFPGTVAKSEKGHRHWTGQINFDEAALLAPLRWKKPARIFVNSMSDLFHENVPDEQIDRIFAVMALCPQHTFQVLTKRADRMREYLAKGITDRIISQAHQMDSIGGAELNAEVHIARKQLLPLPNVWLGVSVENQQAADERIPHLLATPAALRWISAEPLLGPVKLDCNMIEDSHYEDWLRGEAWDGVNGGLNQEIWGQDEGPKLDWVVTGGESGKDARPMHPDWARSLRDQCAAAGVPFFFKQWGEWAPCTIDDFGTLNPPMPMDSNMMKWRRWVGDSTRAPHPGEKVSTWLAPGTLAAPLGKKRAGRLLDGTLHDAFPQVPQ